VGQGAKYFGTCRRIPPFTDEENTLVWMRYDLEKLHQEIWEALHMSRANYFRFKDEVIGKIARYNSI